MLGFVTTTLVPAGMQGQGAALDATRHQASVRDRDFLFFIEGKASTAPQDAAVEFAPIADSAAEPDAAFAPGADEDLETAKDAADLPIGQTTLESSEDDMVKLATVEVLPDRLASEPRPEIGSEIDGGVKRSLEAKPGAEAPLENDAAKTGAIIGQIEVGAEAGATVSGTLVSGPAGPVRIGDMALAAGGLNVPAGRTDAKTPGAMTTRDGSLELDPPERVGVLKLAGNEITPPAKAVVQSGAVVGDSLAERFAGLVEGAPKEERHAAQSLPQVPADQSSIQDARWGRPVPAVNAGLLQNTVGLAGLNAASASAKDTSDHMNRGTEAALGLDPALPRAFADMRQGAIANGQPVARHVAVQLAEAAAKGADRTIDILLNPSELGRVRITMTHGDAGLVVNIAAERSETLELMRRNGEVLGRSFEEIGQGGAEFTFSQEQRSKNQPLPEAEQNSPAPLLLMPSADVESLGVADRLVAVDRLDIRL